MTIITMPELPEVETIRLKLIPDLVDKAIKKVEIIEKKQFSGNQKDLLGKKILAIQRTGKVLNILLDNNLYINIHLKMTGQILFAKNVNKAVFNNAIPFTNTNIMPGKTTRVIFYFTDKSVVFFNDMRKFGWVKIGNTKEGPKSIDVMAENFTEPYLKKILLSSRKPIKNFLLDQGKLAGIGNIYANDSLFMACIHPLRPAKSLTDLETKELYKGIKQVIKDGLRDLGSSGADEAFVLPDGSKGNHQRNFLVYQRQNQPCTVCKTLIKRIMHNGRSSFFCPDCQK